jgi:tetratricopeptide (TPR) repeat protein
MAKPRVSQAEYERLLQTVQMFEEVARTQPNDIQSLEILKEAYLNLGRDAESVATSKKIARAYLSAGQLSSAILEYEGILQRYPDDAEARAALEELEQRMAGVAAAGADQAAAGAAEQVLADAEQFEDGNEALLRFFQENGLVSEKDGVTVLAAIGAAANETSSAKPSPSLLAMLAERGIASVEKSLGLIVEKTRLPFLPLGICEVDSGRANLVEREFCLRHLVLPFDQVSRTLLVATVNPFDTRAKHHVEAAAGTRVQWYVTTPEDMTSQLRNVFRLAA